MKILKRLYIKEFFGILSLTGIGLSIMFSLINLIEKLDDFMRWQPSIADLLLYAALNVPKNLFYILPMAILICSLFVFTQAAKRNEIVAIKAAGGRIKSLIMPFILIGFTLSAIGLFLGEFLMPVALEKANELKITITSSNQHNSSKRNPYQRPSFNEGTIWLKGKDGSIIRIGLYLYENDTAKDISIFLLEKGHLSGKIEAEEALWNGEIWMLRKAKRYLLDSGRIEKIEEMQFPQIQSPTLFKEWLKKPEEMRMGELLRYIKRLKQSGYKNPKLIVDFNSRLSYPLINLFMLILGISLSLRSTISRGLIAAGIGLSISLLYWVGYILSLSMGNANIIPPPLSPWLMPAIFAFISIHLFRNLAE